MPDDFAEQTVALLPNLRRYALSLCRSGDMAEDLVQTTLVRAFAARDQWDPATKVDGWLFRILRNAWIDLARRKVSHGVTVDIDDMPEAAQVDGRTVTEARLMLGSVQEAMDRLPAEQREVMLLICVEEMSYVAAAGLIGVPVGTVMSRLSRARLGIAKMLGING